MSTANRLSRTARDIERHLGAICSVTRNTRCGLLRTNQSRAVSDAVAFFAGPCAAAHRECVEQILPALRSSAAKSVGVLDPLLALYIQAETHQTNIGALARRWLALGVLDAADGTEMRSELERLQNVYARLLPMEEEVLYPIVVAMAGANGSLRAANAEVR